MHRITCVLLLCLLGICLPVACQQEEVTVGVQVWSYDRVYPLLDGLLQDAASTQLQQLILDPNKANSTQLDALIQSLQVQAGFNQMAGVQNSVAAQIAQTNLAYQSALNQQQQNVMQASLLAQQALTKANQDLAAANASQSQAQINAANLEVQNAQALVTGLAAEAASVKGSGTTWTPSPASSSNAASTTNFASGVPSTVLSAGSSAAGPSFPATKQLDNQLDLLWSRLARVVGAMARPDSIAPLSRMYLIEFDTATSPSKSRKGDILETRYTLSCGEVIDLFPRVAAVNIANTKYRDNADIFGVILSWFSFGINASYNREHLKMSQTLGQSSYITGYGIDQAQFGWKFGIPLGDNYVSTDTKRTFALVAMPPLGCDAPQLTLTDVIWKDPKGVAKTAGKTTQRFSAVEAQMAAETASAPVATSNRSAAQVTGANQQPNSAATGGVEIPTGGPAQGTGTSGSPSPQPVPAPSAAAPDAAPAETSISFNRASYDATKYTPANPVLVAVSVYLKDPIDQQATVYANGVVLKRARDTFGRAVPNGTGSGGLLEESTSIAQANTWIPISRHNLLITLDAGQFGTSFPSVQIVAPGQEKPIHISTDLQSDIGASISGQAYRCFSDPNSSSSVGSCFLPSLAYQTPVTAVVSVFMQEISSGANGSVDKLVLQAPLPATTSTVSPGSAAQVTSGMGVNPWGPNAEVYIQVPSQSVTQYRMNCESGDSAAMQGGNLVCDFWSYESQEFDRIYAYKYPLRLTVVDQGHIGGALVATADLPSSAWGKGSQGPAPHPWNVTSPQWYDDSNGGHWELNLQFANTDDKSSMTISPAPTSSTKPLAPASCDSSERICTWTVKIAPSDLPQWFDRMNLTFNGYPNKVWQLLNVRTQISPYVNTMKTDFSSWTGNNFTSVFTSGNDPTGKAGIFIGPNTSGKAVPIDCPQLTTCVVPDVSKLGADAGVMYLRMKDQNQLIPLLQLNSDGSTQPITFQPPKKDQTGTSSPAPGQSNPNPSPTGFTIQNHVVVITGNGPGV